MDISDKSTSKFLEYTEHYSTLVTVCSIIVVLLVLPST